MLKFGNKFLTSLLSLQLVPTGADKWAGLNFVKVAVREEGLLNVLMG